MAFVILSQLKGNRAIVENVKEFLLPSTQLTAISKALSPLPDG